MKKNILCLFTAIFLSIISAYSQPGTAELMNAIQKMNSSFEDIEHRFDVIEKKIDDVQWYNKVGDIAFIDKVYFTGQGE